MTAALLDIFRARGYGDDDAASRTALLERVERVYVQRAGAQPLWRWFVPGRIEVFGKHTDYAGGRSLVCAVPRGFAVAAGPRDDGAVRIIDAKDGREALIDPYGRHPAAGWINYVTVVARRLAHNFPGTALGTDIAVLSDLPRAAGLSSSSALVVSVASALIARAALAETGDWRDRFATDHALAWYLGCVENGLDFPGLPGTCGVGTLGGSEDHTAILTSRAGHLSQHRYAPVVPLGETAMPEPWTFVVATSGVHADKAGTALERYNALSRATRRALAAWNAHRADDAPTLAVALARAGGLEALAEALAATGVSAAGDDMLTRRVRHFVREDARVPAAAVAVAAADRARLSALAAETQHDAEALLGNQVPETSALAAHALAAGAWAASSFGAGFGGSVWALTTASDATAVGREWVARYRAQWPDARNVDWFVAAPGPGRLPLPAGGR